MTRFIKQFFAEKEVPTKVFQVEDKTGLTHFISTEVCIEWLKNAPTEIQRKAEGPLRQIDFHNGDVNHFFEHVVAPTIADSYNGTLRQ